MNLFTRYFAGLLLLACLACQNEESRPKQKSDATEKKQKLTPRAASAPIKQTWFGAETDIKIGRYTEKYVDTHMHRKDTARTLVEFSKEVTLTAQQKEELFNLFYSEPIKREKRKEADCYNPRNMISFYQKGARKAFIEICFQCGGSFKRGSLPAATSFYPTDSEVGDFIASLGINTRAKE